MLIWLFQVGGNYPFQKNAREMGMALRANALRESGHSIVWWGSNFHHPTKIFLSDSYKEITIDEHYKINLLAGISYKRNICLRRYIGYKLIARCFRRKAEFYEKPDLMVVGVPDYDLAHEAIRFAQRNEIPVVVDIADCWPDIFIDRVSKGFKFLAKILLLNDFRKIRVLLSNATALVACSETYLNWGLEKISREKTDKDKVFYHGYKKPEFGNDSVIHENVKQLCLDIKDKKVFTFVGTFGCSYDLSIIVKAARIFEQRGINDVHFVLVGDGQQAGRVRKEAEDLKNISFTGWLNIYEVGKVLQVSNVGLATYAKNAPQSMTFKQDEYIAYGLPMLSSLKGELKEFIEKYGIGRTYISGDLNSFCKRIEEFLKNPEKCVQMSKNAFNLYQTEIDAQMISRKYAKYLEKIQISHCSDKGLLARPVVVNIGNSGKDMNT